MCGALTMAHPEGPDTQDRYGCTANSGVKGPPPKNQKHKIDMAFKLSSLDNTCSNVQKNDSSKILILLVTSLRKRTLQIG